VAKSRRSNGMVLGSIIAAIVAVQSGRKAAPAMGPILTSTLTA
jgi:hypothetical protein